MEVSENKIREYMRRIMLSRMRILNNHGFYGLLLMHLKFAVDSNCTGSSTDGERIFLSPEFLEELSDNELDFVLTHELLHIIFQHCFRCGNRDKELFSRACDIVVNSNILLTNGGNLSSIIIKKYGTAIHFAPNYREGSEYTAEEVYDMILRDSAKKESKKKYTQNSNSNKSGNSNKKPSEDDKDDNNSPQWGCHDRWDWEEDEQGESMLAQLWKYRMIEACEAIERRERAMSAGLLPAFAKRMLEQLKQPQTNWREVLDAFVQEEINDYSFSPPDRRFSESPFFLPDYNEKDETVKNILFMIDTSASMTDEMITAAYSEVKGAIDQFNGRLVGWLGFFDGEVVEPKPFSGIDEFLIIRPEGGGGTSFKVIFRYIQEHMQDDLPASIVILTDGQAPFPALEETMDIPVLWLLNNEDVTPPWGKIARIKMQEDLS